MVRHATTFESLQAVRQTRSPVIHKISIHCIVRALRAIWIYLRLSARILGYRASLHTMLVALPVDSPYFVGDSLTSLSEINGSAEST